MSLGTWFPEKPDPLMLKELDVLEPLLSVGSDPGPKLVLLIVADMIVMFSVPVVGFGSVDGQFAGLLNCVESRGASRKKTGMRTGRGSTYSSEASPIRIHDSFPRNLVAMIKVFQESRSHPEL